MQLSAKLDEAFKGQVSELAEKRRAAELALQERMAAAEEAKSRDQTAASAVDDDEDAALPPPTGGGAVLVSPPLSPFESDDEEGFAAVGPAGPGPEIALAESTLGYERDDAERDTEIEKVTRACAVPHSPRSVSADLNDAELEYAVDEPDDD